MYRCSGCGTAFVYPLPSEDQLARFYDSYHRSSAEGGWYDEVEARIQADFPAKIALILRATGGSPGRLLDVGCGKGFFVKACVERGIRAEGVDISSSGIEYATRVLGVRATCGALKEIRDHVGSFDTITFWATIEHLPEPVQALRHIAAALKPGGHLLLSTGTGDDWLDRLLPGRVQWFDPPQHLFVFSVEGLRRAVAAAGLTLCHLDSSFERSTLRRWVRFTRSVVTAALLRVAAEIGRVRHDRFVATRFPLGNHTYAVARRT
jgi:SAM-dependent methyltransferase